MSIPNQLIEIALNRIVCSRYGIDKATHTKCVANKSNGMKHVPFNTAALKKASAGN